MSGKKWKNGEKTTTMRFAQEPRKKHKSAAFC